MGKFTANFPSRSITPSILTDRWLLTFQFPVAEADTSVVEMLLVTFNFTYHSKCIGTHVIELLKFKDFDVHVTYISKCLVAIPLANA